MKKVLNKLVLLTLSTLVSVSAYSQKSFEGTVVYGMEMLGDVDPQVQAMMPTEMKLVIKGDLTRTEMAMAMGTNVVIANTKEKTGTVLMDMMGQRIAMKIDDKMKEAASEKDKSEDKYDVKLTDETKEIAGYKCKKALVTNSETKETYDVYYCDELPGMSTMNMPSYKGIDGMMMEFQGKMGGMGGEMTTKMSVKSIKKEKVKDDLFAVPADYKVMTQEELMKQFGGGDED